MSVLLRDGEPGGSGAGGARLPHALPPELPRVAPRPDDAVLEEGAGREAHLRVHPVLPGRLLHGHGAAVPARGQPVAGGRREREADFSGNIGEGGPLHCDF